MSANHSTPNDRSPEAVPSRLAREDETARLMHRHMMAESFVEGFRKGREGAEGPRLRQSVRENCKRMGVEFTPPRAQQVDALSLHDLADLLKAIETERQWPEQLMFQLRFSDTSYGAQERLNELVRAGVFPPKVKEPPEDLIAESDVLRLVKRRENALLVQRQLFDAAYEMGRNEARAKFPATRRDDEFEKVIEEGRVKELLAAVRTLCEAFGIEVDARRDHQFASLKVDQLTQLVDHLKTERKWPDEG